jgi:hypothetical protein
MTQDPHHTSATDRNLGQRRTSPRNAVSATARISAISSLPVTDCSGPHVTTLAELKAQKDAARARKAAQGMVQLPAVNMPSAKKVRRQFREHTKRLNAERQAKKSRRPRGPRGTRRTEADDSKSQTQNKARSISVDVASSNSDNRSASRIIANEPSPANA